MDYPIHALRLLRAGRERALLSVCGLGQLYSYHRTAVGSCTFFALRIMVLGMGVITLGMGVTTLGVADHAAQGAIADAKTWTSGGGDEGDGDDDGNGGTLSEDAVSAAPPTPGRDADRDGDDGGAGSTLSEDAIREAPPALCRDADRDGDDDGDGGTLSEDTNSEASSCGDTLSEDTLNEDTLREDTLTADTLWEDDPQLRLSRDRRGVDALPGKDAMAMDYVFTDDQLMIVKATLIQGKATMGVGSEGWEELHRRLLDALFMRGMAIIRRHDGKIPMADTFADIRLRQVPTRRWRYAKLEEIQHKRRTLQRQDPHFAEETGEDFAAWFSQL